MLSSGEKPTITPPEPQKILIPRGEVILGRIDPSALTELEFLNSPDLLYHAAANPFEFNQNALVSNFDNPVSSTLGRGFYATDSIEEAELFAKAREGGGAHPLVIPLLPFQAKMFDFRGKTDSEQNAQVTPEMIRAWKQFYLDDFHQKFPEGFKPDFTIRPLSDHTTEYLNRAKYVNRLRSISGQKPHDLRELLSFDEGRSGAQGGDTFFSNFMLGQGYDGAIYVEGGDAPGQKNPTSFVFYNYKKVGTYEAWHKGQK